MDTARIAESAELGKAVEQFKTDLPAMLEGLYTMLGGAPRRPTSRWSRDAAP